MSTISHRLGRIGGSLLAAIVPALFGLVGVAYVLFGVTQFVLATELFFDQATSTSLSLGDLLLPLVGVALCLVALGLHQRRRDIWLLSIVMLVAFSFASWAPFSAVDDDSGVSVAALVVNALLILALVVTARRYTVRGSNLMTPRSYLAFAVAVAAIAVGYVAAARWAVGAGWAEIRSFSFVDSGDTITSLQRVQLLAVGAVVLAGVVLLARLLRSLRPDRHRLSPADTRALLRAHGGDSLDYFVTNEKKRQFVWRDGRGLVGYELSGGLALVSGDPIVDAEDRDSLVSDLRSEMESQRHDVAFWAISESFAESLAARGMHTVKLGEEATVDVDDFDLDALGADGSGLRRAARSVESKGIDFAFYRMEDVPGSVYSQMAELDQAWLREFGGSDERGFSMTLSRLPDFDDHDAAFAVALERTNDGPARVVAYLSFVPVYNRNSYSLDMMRRSASAPNGINDFLLVHTLQIVRHHGRRSVSLNFAPLAETGGDASTIARLASSLPERLKKSFYIDSLYAYNDKFGPTWIPRYAAFESRRDALSVVRAVAQLEGSIEVAGRRRLAEWIAGPDYSVTKSAHVAERVGTSDT